MNQSISYNRFLEIIRLIKFIYTDIYYNLDEINYLELEDSAIIHTNDFTLEIYRENNDVSFILRGKNRIEKIIDNCSIKWSLIEEIIKNLPFSYCYLFNSVAYDLPEITKRLDIKTNSDYLINFTKTTIETVTREFIETFVNTPNNSFIRKYYSNHTILSSKKFKLINNTQNYSIHFIENDAWFECFTNYYPKISVDFVDTFSLDLFINTNKKLMNVTEETQYKILKKLKELNYTTIKVEECGTKYTITEVY